MKSLAFFILMLFFVGCGYYPVAHFTKKALGENIYVSLKVHVANAENSVAIKDMLNRLIVARFQKKLTDQESADTIITIEITSVNDSSIATNSDGFTTFYRAGVGVRFDYKSKKGEEKTFHNYAYSDYAVSLEDPLITYSNRLEAINNASNQCIDKFLTQIAYQGKQ